MLRLTLLENLASALIQIALFYFTTRLLGFSPAENLALAVVHGGVYTGAALLSARWSAWLGERRGLAVLLAGQVVLAGLLAAFPTRAMVWGVTPMLLALYGMKWPIVETYVTAGKTPREAAGALGRFNLVWSGAVAGATMGAGSLMTWSPGALFVVSAGATCLSLPLLFAVASARAEHLAADHPERPVGMETARLAGLLSSARWSMLLSYAFLQVINPLMPTVLEGLGVGLAWATVVGATPLLARWVTFGVLGAWPGWHGRRWPLAGTAVALPIAGLVVIDGSSLGGLIAGAVVFGAAAGTAYFASLWYATTLENAAVDAGGHHEAVIGAGFLVGPVLGTVAARMSEATAFARVGAYGLALLPVVVGCTATALWRLRGAGRGEGADSAGKDVAGR